MNKCLAWFLVSVLIAGLILSGCSSSAPASSPSPLPTTSAPIPSVGPASSPASKPVSTPSPTSTQVITLRYADQQAEGSWAGKNADAPWLKSMEDATGGRVKFQAFYSESLCKATDAWQATKNGVADVAWCWHGYWANLTPLADVLGLPFLPFKSGEQATGVFWQLLDKYPSLSQQFKDNKILLYYCGSPYYLITTKKQVKVMDDIKGLKIRVPGGGPTDMMKILGAVPVSMGMPDTYLNMQKGVIDGMGTVWEANMSFRQYEVAKYFTYIPLWVTYFTQAMNWDKWNSLPPDIQKALESVNGVKGSQRYTIGFNDSAGPAALAAAKNSGYSIVEYTVPPEEIQKWQAVGGKPLWDDWVKKTKAAGYPEAEQILNSILDLAK
jgi:TRAP-type transport system periplasmic protein